jgi:biopolymer transport protein ExbB/TolQ
MNTVWKFITDHKKFFTILGACILGLLLLWGVIRFAESAWNQHKINQDYQNLNIAVQQASNINANLANLQQQYNQAVNNASVSKQELSNIREQVNVAKVESNQAVANVEAVKNQVSNNVTVDQANAARCAAFPDSPECR